jgi:hypothetical protein
VTARGGGTRQGIRDKAHDGTDGSTLIDNLHRFHVINMLFIRSHIQDSDGE